MEASDKEQVDEKETSAPLMRTPLGNYEISPMCIEPSGFIPPATPILTITPKDYQAWLYANNLLGLDILRKP